MVHGKAPPTKPRDVPQLPAVDDKTIEVLDMPPGTVLNPVDPQDPEELVMFSGAKAPPLQHPGLSNPGTTQPAEQTQQEEPPADVFSGMTTDAPPLESERTILDKPPGMETIPGVAAEEIPLPETPPSPGLPSTAPSAPSAPQAWLPAESPETAEAPSPPPVDAESRPQGLPPRPFELPSSKWQ